MNMSMTISKKSMTYFHNSKVRKGRRKCSKQGIYISEKQLTAEVREC
jgi:hypothetical protein